MFADPVLGRIGQAVELHHPSLHLNLAECYRKLGDLTGAREHLQRAQTGIGAWR